jgi:hypothetical protein
LADLTPPPPRLNRLPSLPEGVSSLVALRAINLSDNSLTQISEELGGIPALTSLDVQRNALTSPPPEVVRAGGGAVIRFLRHMHQSRDADEAILTGWDFGAA